MPIDWNWADAEWASLFARNGLQRTYRLHLYLDPASRQCGALDETSEVAWTAGAVPMHWMTKDLNGKPFDASDLTTDMAELYELAYYQAGDRDVETARWLDVLTTAADQRRLRAAADDAAANRHGVYFHDYGGNACHHGFCHAMTVEDADNVLQRLDRALVGDVHHLDAGRVIEGLRGEVIARTHAR